MPSTQSRTTVRSLVARGGLADVRGFILAGFVIALGIGHSGCGTDAEPTLSPEPAPYDPDLGHPLGGFGATDEEPAFGDPAVAALVEGETEFDDPVTDDPKFASLSTDPRARAFALSLLWGRLERTDTEPGDGTTTLDWSGRLRLSRGMLVLERLVDFEGSDEAPAQRLDARELRWTSRAGGGSDGIRVTVWNRNDSDGDTLFFQSGPFSAQWSIASLAEVDLTEMIPGAGQQIAVRSVRISGERREGFAQGFWRLAPAGTLDPAQFAGRWIDARGEVIGFVRGIYGTNSSGEQLLFGKWIDREGTFRGFLRGTWMNAPDSPGPRVATFQAEILERTRGSDRLIRVGACEGRWRVAANRDDGAFEARWCLDC